MKESIFREAAFYKGRQKGAATFFQPKLTINQPGDVYEQEADAMADKVMRMKDSAAGPFFNPSVTAIQRKCKHCEEEEKVQRKDNGNAVATDHSLDSYIGNLSGGQFLSGQERNFFEPRFGRDFSAVKLHTDAAAAQSAQSIGALAYTSGNNIVFNNGQFSPDTHSGRELLAHELTHVVQQQSAPQLIQRQLAGGQPDEFVDMRDGAPHASTCGGPSYCPASFCQPHISENFARHQRDQMAPYLLAGIALFVNSRVLPLWTTYLFGGSAPQNLTSEFGSDFAASPTTHNTTLFLIGAIRNRLQTSPPAFPPGLNTVTISLASLIASELTAINTPDGPHEMNFNVPSDIAGNLAGGIGTNQTTCRSGALPSPFNDSRIADGIVTIIKDAAGNLTVIPVIMYEVRDTIDLCPGNCGTGREQIATVPMSQFEATGISGDVPFTINFPAVTPPFVIPHS